MSSEQNKNKKDIIRSLNLSHIFNNGKKTKDINEEIYLNVNFPDPDKLTDTDKNR